ncbi:MAG: DUF1566 domain-containing protein [Bacteroidota bacterium]
MKHSIAFPQVILLFLLCVPQLIYAQVGINNNNGDPDPSAMLDVQSTEKGILVPRMTSAQRSIISNPATGLLVFDISTNSFWFYDGSNWADLSANATPDELSDADGNTKVQVEKNANENRIRFSINGTEKAQINASKFYVNVDQGLAFPASFNADPAYVGTTGNALIFGHSGVSEDFIGYKSNTFYFKDSPGGGDNNDPNISTGGTIFAGAFSGDGSALTGISVDDADADAANELQSLNLLGNTLSISNGNSVSLPAEVDGDVTNELQTLSLSVDTLKLSDGGFVKLPSDEVPDPSLPIPIRFQGSEIYVHPTDNAASVNWPTAQTTCANLTAYGHNDWYLPSKLELDAMYKQSYLITGLSQTSAAKYWSDTEQDATNAFTQRLDYGGPDPDPKTDTSGHNCRCVRKN